MKINCRKMLALAGATLLLGLSSSDTLAQNRPGRGERGDFGPEQMRQRMAERMKEQLGVVDDAAWKVIVPRIEKVMEARRETGGFGGGPAFRGPRPGGDDDGPGRRGPAGRGAGPEPSAAIQDLRAALEQNASEGEIKAKLATVREERKRKEQELAKAREELKEVLSVQQEAHAVLMGLLE